MCAAKVRLVAADLDGTLIRGDTVCETIAGRLGHLERMRELERLTSIDEIAAGRLELAGLYAGASLAELQAYLRYCRLAPGAREGFQLLHRAGIKTAIISITWEFAVAWFARELGADYYAGTRLSDEGEVAHFWPQDKAEYLSALMHRLGLARDEVAAIGDSWGDVEMLRLAGHAYYVGATLPQGVQLPHYPDADLHELARLIIGAS